MDEIQKSTPTPAQLRMAKARAVRDANRAQRAVQPAEAPAAADDIQRAGGRTPLRSGSNGRVEVVGRNGEVLSRSRIQGVDPFEVPAHLIPNGWEYQWNPVTITGN